MVGAHQVVAQAAQSILHQTFHQAILETLEQYTPHLATRLQKGTQAERFVGTGDLPNFFRHPYGPGWALAGDAGHCKDPILAHGISDAFRDAQLLADAIESGLSSRRPLQEALADLRR